MCQLGCVSNHLIMFRIRCHLHPGKANAFEKLAQSVYIGNICTLERCQNHGRAFKNLFTGKVKAGTLNACHGMGTNENETIFCRDILHILANQPFHPCAIHHHGAFFEIFCMLAHIIYGRLWIKGNEHQIAIFGIAVNHEFICCIQQLCAEPYRF